MFSFVFFFAQSYSHITTITTGKHKINRFGKHTWNYTQVRNVSIVHIYMDIYVPWEHHIQIPGSAYWLQSIPLSENASTSLGKSLESMILNPIELPCWFSCSHFRYPKAQPTGAPSMYALQANKIYLDRWLKCSSTNASKCCTKEARNKIYKFFM